MNIKYDCINMTYIEALLRSGELWDLYKLERDMIQFRVPIELIKQPTGTYVILNPTEKSVTSIVDRCKHLKNPISKIWKEWVEFQTSMECFYHTNGGVYDDD